MDMVVHRFNDHIREDLARIGLDKRTTREKTGRLDKNDDPQLATA